MWRIVAGLAALFLTTTPAHAEWLRAESGNFIVYGEITRGRLRERVLLLEEFDRLLRVLTGTTEPPSPNKLTVYLVHGTREMRNIAPVGYGTGGFYRASADAIVAVADESQEWHTNEDDTLLHEYAHHFMMQHHPAPYPRWYSEGFAEYVMTADIRPDRIEYGNYNLARVSWLSYRQLWMPYERVLFPDRNARINWNVFYSQSWLLVHYIMQDAGRRAALVNYVQAIARGEDARQAFTAAFGMRPADLDRELRDYARRITFHRITRTASDAAPEVRIERIGGAAINLPLIEAALNLGVAGSERDAVLARARRAGRGEDAFGKRIQARAEILFGDLAAADRLLDGLLAAAPADAELLYLKGLRHLVAGRRDAAARRAEYRQAQIFFSRAHRANPNHFPTLYRYAEALSEGDQMLTENTQNILLLATSLAPQVSEIRLAAAHLLLLREQYDQALALLLPLNESPHEGSEHGRLQELLRLARARQRPTDGVVFKVPNDA